QDIFLACMPSRDRRTQGPTHTCDLQGDHAGEEVTARGASRGDVRPNQEEDTGEADKEPKHEPDRQWIPVAGERFDADHPERDGGDGDGGYTTRYPLLCPNHTAITHTYRENTGQGEAAPVRRANDWFSTAGEQRDEQDAGGGEAKSSDKRRRNCLERDSD